MSTNISNPFLVQHINSLTSERYDKLVKSASQLAVKEAGDVESFATQERKLKLTKVFKPTSKHMLKAMDKRKKPFSVPSATQTPGLKLARYIG